MSESGKPAWMRAQVESVVSSAGAIAARVLDIEPVYGSRPRTIEDVGADEEALNLVRARFPGTYLSSTYIGGATAVSFPFEALELFEGDRKWDMIKRLGEKYDYFSIGRVLGGFVRNTMAPSLWNCAEPCGGMAQSERLLEEQTREIVELGVYNQEGWLSFRANSMDEQYQQALIEEQARCWNIVRPGLPMLPEPAVLKHLPIGADSLDGLAGTISVGNVGNYSLTCYATLDLYMAFSYRLQDLELHFDGEAWQPLNRTPVIVSKRDLDGGKSPIMLFCDRHTGLLDDRACHVALSGEALEYNISYLMKDALGPRGLNWLPNSK